MPQNRTSTVDKVKDSKSEVILSHQTPEEILLVLLYKAFYLKVVLDNTVL